MPVPSLRLLALASLVLAAAAALPRVGHAEEGAAETEGGVAAPATQKASPAKAPWWGGAVDVTPKPWLRGTGEEPWQFIVAAYLWFPNAPAEITIGHGDVTLPENVGTIYDSLQYGMMLDLETHKGRFGAYFSPILVWLRDSNPNNTVQGPIQQHQLIASESVYLLDFGLSYEIGQWALWNKPDWIIPSPAVTLEPFFGARPLVDDLTITLNPGGDFKPRISFITPVIGARLLWDITDRFNVRASGDYGGFGGVDGVNTTWKADVLLGYRFKPWKKLHLNVFAGYGQLHIDYSKVASIKVDIKGPFLGLAFEFAADRSGFVPLRR